jgi:hypothetical protein
MHRHIGSYTTTSILFSKTESLNANKRTDPEEQRETEQRRGVKSNSGQYVPEMKNDIYMSWNVSKC